MNPRTFLALSWTWAITGCASFVPLGSMPPENPDFQPPVEARVVLRKASLQQPGSHSGIESLRGTIQHWDEDRLVLALDDCKAGGPLECNLQFRIADIQTVEAREPFPAEYTAVIVLSAIAMGLVVYGLYWIFDPGNLGLGDLTWQTR